MHLLQHLCKGRGRGEVVRTSQRSCLLRLRRRKTLCTVLVRRSEEQLRQVLLRHHVGLGVLATEIAIVIQIVGNVLQLSAQSGYSTYQKLFIQ